MSKNHIYIRRLNKIADFIEKLPDEQFDFRKIVSEARTQKNGTTCGTVCCVIGWFPRIFPKHYQWIRKDHLVNDGYPLVLNNRHSSGNFGVFTSISGFLNLKTDEFYNLFVGSRVGLNTAWNDFELYENSNKATVVSGIRNYIKWKYK